MAVQAPAVYFYGVYKDFTVPAKQRLLKYYHNSIIRVQNF
jgi:hypothetical protein